MGNRGHEELYAFAALKRAGGLGLLCDIKEN